MPVINGRYYMNPQYGQALERNRIADEEFTRLHAEPEPSWLDHFLGFAAHAEAQHLGKDRDNTRGRITANTRDRDRSDRAAMSYSEKADGTVAEHEAIQSTVMNRVASGDRQYVRRGEPVNESNVIHSPHQYQGVPDINEKRSAEANSNFFKFKSRKATGQGAVNAAAADEDLRRTGKPTNDATFFIVNPGGKPPTEEQVHRMGSVEPAGRVGDVYLYRAKPRTQKR